MPTFPSIPPIALMASDNPNGFPTITTTTAEGGQTATIHGIFTNAPQGVVPDSLLDITNEATPWKIIPSEEPEVHVEARVRYCNPLKRTFSRFIDNDCDDEETLAYALRTVTRRVESELRHNLYFTKSPAMIFQQVKSPASLKHHNR